MGTKGGRNRGYQQDTLYNFVLQRNDRPNDLRLKHASHAPGPVSAIDVPPLVQTPFGQKHRHNKEFLPQEKQSLFDDNGKIKRGPLAPAA